MTLDIRLLGQLVVLRDGRRVDLRSRPAQLLLAYLALHTAQSIPRDKVAGELWPDVGQDTARKNLRQTLWRLRRAIGDDDLEVGRGSLRLRPGSVTSDVGALLSDDVPDDAEALASSLQAYGELLPGHYADWIQSATGPLRATYENRMARLLRALATQGRWSEVRSWSERWIAQGAVPERAYRALMKAHAGMGDLVGVANAYRRCVTVLRDELGVQPSARTRALHQRLMAGDASALGRGPVVAGSQATPPSIRHDGARPVIEQAVVINRPNHQVFASMLDPDIALLYRSNVVRYDLVAGRPGEVGTRVSASRKVGSEILDFLVEVVEADPGRWLVSRTVDSPLRLRIETRLVDVPGGTRMTQRRELELPKGVGGDVDESVLLRWYAADVHSELHRLKELLEVR